MLALLVNGRSTPQYRRIAVRLNEREKLLVRVYINFMKRIDENFEEYQADLNREYSILMGYVEMTYEDFSYFQIGMEGVESAEFSLGDEMRNVLMDIYKGIELAFYDRNTPRVDMEACLWQPTEEELDEILGADRHDRYAEYERLEKINVAKAYAEMKELGLI